MKHLLCGRVGTDVEVKTGKNGNEYVQLALYSQVGQYKENSKEKTHDDICYSCVCTKQSEIDKIKEMDLKKGDTIQLVGILSSETYEKNGKKVVKPKYFIDYLDPKKNKEASLYKFVDEDMSESINRFNELKMQELQQTKADKSAEMTIQF